MQENFKRINEEKIQFGIKVTKIEPIIQGDAPKTKYLRNDKSQTREIDKQVLKPEDIQFEKLPFQKLLPIPFVNCIKSFSRIERCDNLIFLDFQMEKKWIDFLIDRIQNSVKSSDNLMFKKNQNETRIDISEIDNTKIYSVYESKNAFRLTFSNKFPNVILVGGVDYLKEYHDQVIDEIQQDQLKNILLNYIIKKWSN
jgi:hypothetical protein